MFYVYRGCIDNGAFHGREPGYVSVTKARGYSEKGS